MTDDERKQAEEILLEIFEMGMDAQEIGMPSFDMIKQTGRIDKMINSLFALTVAELQAELSEKKKSNKLLHEAMVTAEKRGYEKAHDEVGETTKQRDELLKLLKELVHLHMCEQEGLLSGQPTPEQWYKAVKKAEMVINKAEEKDENNTYISKGL